jgi:hypothetical protein
MHFHLPKPLHGWREFAGEVSIIVLGVLIALGAEQVVERFTWAQRARSAQEAMSKELLWDDGPQVYQRAALHNCLQAKLDDIRSAVEANRPRAEIVKLTAGYKLPFLTYDSLAHDSANASGVFEHIPADNLQKWTNAYSVIPMMDRTASREAADMAHLNAVRSIGGPLSVAEGDRLLDAVEAVRNDERVMWSATRAELPAIAKLHGNLDAARVNIFMAFARKQYGSCVKNFPRNWDGTVG